MEGTALDPRNNPDFSLITSDGKHIGVNIKALCMVSTVFKDMMEANSSSDDSTCEVSETESEFSLLLLAIQTGKISRLETLQAVFKLVDKYDVPWLDRSLRRDLELWVHVNRESFQKELLMAFDISCTPLLGTAKNRIALFENILKKRIHINQLKNLPYLSKPAISTLVFYAAQRNFWLHKILNEQFERCASRHKQVFNCNINIKANPNLLEDLVDQLCQEAIARIYSRTECVKCIEKVFKNADSVRLRIAERMEEVGTIVVSHQ